MEISTVKPTSDRVVIKPLAAEEVSKGGIIIPDVAKEKPSRGSVIAIGPGMTDRPMMVQVGDNVLYSRYAGTEVTFDDEVYVMMRESDIYAIY